MSFGPFALNGASLLTSANGRARNIGLPARKMRKTRKKKKKNEKGIK